MGGSRFDPGEAQSSKEQHAAARRESLRSQNDILDAVKGHVFISEPGLCRAGYEEP